ncbi:MAG: hypothetical protein Q7R87_01275 [Nanoarchaeota archaeon]|nr:hypothetical protein [Nanoarchaeota archaeon]
MKKKFINIGWKSKLMQKRSTFSITINKVVAVGSDLQKGQEIYCYLAEDEKKRPIMIAYLDGKPKNTHK